MASQLSNKAALPLAKIWDCQIWRDCQNWWLHPTEWPASNQGIHPFHKWYYPHSNFCTSDDMCKNLLRSARISPWMTAKWNFHQIWNEGKISLVKRGPWAPFQYPIKTSYCKISWSLKAVRLVSLWNLTGTLAALLPRCLSNFRAIGQF